MPAATTSSAAWHRACTAYSSTRHAAGYSFTSAAQGAPGSGGSDADTGSGKTGQVTRSSGDNLTVRAGLTVQQGTLGDRVWEDSNGNGVQDSGEAGIDGVKVDLKDSLGNTVASTVSHDGGQYSFTVDPVPIRSP
jgi:hypothetical protein